MGGDGRGQYIQREEPPPSSPLLWRNARNFNATLEYLPPAVVSKAWNLQNFFPFMHLLEEEKVVELDEAEN